MKDDIRLCNHSLIRPITLARYTLIKNRDIERDDIDILDMANTFVKLGIDNGLRGDLLFILVLYMNDIEVNSIPRNNDLCGIGPSDTYELNIRKIIKYVCDMRDGAIPYESDNSELCIGDVICNLKPPGYNKLKYINSSEALAFEDSYLHQFNKLYNNIFEFERLLLLDNGEVIKPIVDVDESEKLYEKNIHDSSNSNNLYDNKKLVVYSNPNNSVLAILLSQNYHCPFVYTKNKKIYEKDFDIIVAEEV